MNKKGGPQQKERKKILKIQKKDVYFKADKKWKKAQINLFFSKLQKMDFGRGLPEGCFLYKKTGQSTNFFFGIYAQKKSELCKRNRM